jgi:branched-chain amino acid transport system ATP-binding protein
MSLLNVEDLQAGYGKVQVLFNGNINVEPGELVGIVGPNGAGKSTFLGAIAGAVKASHGTIEFGGESIRSKNPEDIVRLGLALVPEGRAIFTDLTVNENLRLGLTGRREKSGAQKAIEEVIDLFPVLTTHRSHQAGLLSGGQQQQLAIARALVSEPKLLMLDEPSLGLSPTVIQDVFGVLNRIQDQGTAIIVVEQRAHLVLSIAARTLVIREGHVRATLLREDAQDEARLAAAYFGTGEDLE